jgi:hypothetical protein
LADGNNTVDLTGITEFDSIFAGSGDDSITWDAASPVAIDGGAGTDTLTINVPVNFVAGNLASVAQNIEVVKLADGANSVDISGLATLDTIIGGSGNDSFTWDADNFVVMDGGAGIDTLAITSALAAPAGAIASVLQNVEVLQLGDGSNQIDLSGVTFVQTVIGGAGNDSVVWDAGSPLTLDGGTGTDTLTIKASVSLVAGDLDRIAPNVEVVRLDSGVADNQVDVTGAQYLQTLIGGAGFDSFIWDAASPIVFDGGVGEDTLSITVPIQFAPGDLASVAQNIEVVKLADGGNTLSAAYATSVSTIVGGTGSDSISAGSVALTMQGWSGASADNTASDTLVGGSKADDFVLGDLNGNAYGTGFAAHIYNFNANAGSNQDKIDLCDFGGAHAAQAGYRLTSGSGVNAGNQILSDYDGHQIAIFHNTNTFNLASVANFIG